MGSNSAGDIFNIGSSLAEGEIQATAIKNQTRFRVLQNLTNAKFAELQERDSIKRGAKRAGRAIKTSKEAKGLARARLAAQGVDVDVGSAADIQADIELAGRLDAIAIENNAYREAFGFKLEAQESRFAARIAQFGGDFRARATLLTGQARAFGSAIKVAGQAGAAAG